MGIVAASEKLVEGHEVDMSKVSVCVPRGGAIAGCVCLSRGSVACVALCVCV